MCHALRKCSLIFVILAFGCWATLAAPSAKTSSPPGNHPASAPVPLFTTVAQIHALSASEAAKGLPVELHAIVTYYEPTEGQVFVQDTTGGIYIVSPPDPPALHPGDAIMIRGTTVPSYSVNIAATEMTFERHADFPAPIPVSWRDLLQKINDCRYVTLVGKIRSATLQSTIGQYSQGGVLQRGTSSASVARGAYRSGGPPHDRHRERQPLGGRGRLQ